MQIGFIEQKEKAFKENKEHKVAKWLECHFRIAGLRPFNAKMSKNKNKTESKHPDYIIYLRSNVNKGENFRDIPIGSLWMGEKVIDGELKKFMTGKMEIAFQEVSIAVWKATPKFQGEVLNYLYDIKTMKDKRNQDEDGYSSNYEQDYDDGMQTPQNAAQQYTQNHQEENKNQTNQAVFDIDDDEIPF